MSRGGRALRQFFEFHVKLEVDVALVKVALCLFAS
jgi:hypothetical protein